MTGHLGARVSALVDGQLGHEERERALRHVARCTRCRAEVEAERAVKGALGSTGIPPASPALTSALLRIADADVVRPPGRRILRRPMRVTADRRRVRRRTGPGPGRPGGRPASRQPPAGRVAAAATMAVAVVAVGLAALGTTAPSGTPSPAPVSRIGTHVGPPAGGGPDGAGMPVGLRPRQLARFSDAADR